MRNAIIIGTGKIGIDLYIKCLKSKIFKNIHIFNRNKLSEGAKFCKKRKFNYSPKVLNVEIKALPKQTKILNETFQN